MPDPISSVEWMGLLLALLASGGASFCYVASFYANRGRFDYGSADEKKERHAKKPWLYSDEVFMIARAISGVMTAVGFWLAWRQGYRAEFGLTAPDDGVPSDKDLWFLNLGYLLYILLSSSFGICFFSIGVEMGWLGVPLFLDMAALAFMILSLVYAYFIWWQAGLIMTFGVALSGYCLLMMIELWRKGSHFLSEPFHDAVHSAVVDIKRVVYDLSHVVTKPRAHNSSGNNNNYSNVNEEELMTSAVGRGPATITSPQRRAQSIPQAMNNAQVPTARGGLVFRQQ